MERNYWIHRISHIAEISYPLHDNNYLSYGWSDFEKDGFIEGVRGESSHVALPRHQEPFLQRRQQTYCRHVVSLVPQ